MFQKARIRLTAYYLLIVMIISVSFSLAIFEVLTQELNRVERVQRLRQVRFQRSPAIDPEVIEEARNRLREILVLINMAILGFSGVAGYFLAGMTLRPISQMVEEQGRFITDASHELRTPLTSLKSEIEVNLRDKNLNLNNAKKLLQSNLEEVNNLQYLSDNLIKLTQYQKDSNRHFEEVNLVEVIEEAIKKVANLAKQKKITIKSQVKSEIVEGDRQSLVELFVIFLDNAIKYSDNSTKVVISSDLNGHPRGRYSISVSIKDQGIGISEEDLPHLFDRFYRADKSRTKSDISGYGLGLSIAKQIIEKHKGSIKIVSKVARGTAFLVQIPIRH